MLIAQITDTHVLRPGRLAYGRVDTNACLAAAVDSLLREKPQPDVVLLSGDLVDAGAPEEYAHLRTLLAPLPMPVLVIPGNHDERRALAAAFADRGYLPQEGFLHYAVEHFPLRLIGLDSIIPGETGGMLCRERLAWLDATLAAAAERPTLIFMHHPPFATGIRGMDECGLDAEASAALAAVLRRHRQVERIVAGHVHRTIQARFAGTAASVAPSTAHQVSLDLRSDAPVGYTLEPPGYHLHRYTPESGVVTHAVTLGAFPGPFSFSDGSPQSGVPPR
jgi:3',5'-cyclic AMP phosphodiesterase CpdA